MRPLVAVDVDGTLLKVDSFRRLVEREMDATLALIAALRLCRLLSREGFAERVMRHLAKHLADTAAMEAWAQSLAGEMDPGVLEIARRAAGADGVIVLLSASPEAYVGPLAARLGLTGIGSRFVGGAFVHCHGACKLRELEARYPRAEYDYALAIADHPSDAPLLAAFRESVWWKR